MFPRRNLFRAAAWVVLAALPAIAAETALDRYVKAPDPTYAYQVVNTVKGEGYTLYVVDLTSQTWRKASEVDHPVWKHWLTIVKPDKVDTSTGYLFITGGSVNEKAPTVANPTYVELATATHSVAAELRGVPNEPVTFAGETRQRSEDAIIAYTWIKYMETGDETWPLRIFGFGAYRGGARYLYRLYVQVRDVAFHAEVGHGDRVRVERIGFDDVGAGV